MDPRLRILAASGVLAGGLVLALLFRHPAVPREEQIPLGNGNVSLRQLPAVAEGGPPNPAGVASPSAAEPSRLSPSTAPAGDRGAQPPDLAKSYPTGGFEQTPRWGISMSPMLPETKRPASPRTHKIVDGDTLPALAEQYLGSRERGGEIFEANRDVLPSPDLLPIGAELKIPPCEPSGSASTSANPPPARTISTAP